MKDRQLKKGFYISLCVLTLTICSQVTTVAQQVPQMSHYMMEKFLYNPAYTGNYYKKYEFVLNNRKQYWRENGPMTSYLGFHAPIRNHNFSVGGRIVSDKISYLYYSGAWATGSYKIWLPAGMLAVGAELGLMNRGINYNKLILTDENDLLFEADNNINYGFSMVPDVGLGLYYTLDNFYAGVSVRHLVPTKFGKINYERDSYNSLKRHYFILAGYQYKLNNDWSFEPSTLIKFTGNRSDLQFDISLLAKYKKYQFGMGYRSEGALTPIISYTKWGFLTFSYSHDIQLSTFGQHFNGNNEILMRLLYDMPKPIIKKRKDPRFY